MIQHWVAGLESHVDNRKYIFYPDQQIHNIYIYINNILSIVSTATCFDTSASSSGGTILELCWRYKNHWAFVGLDNKPNKMHRTYIKTAEAEQARMYKINKNTKLNFLKNETPTSGTTKYVKSKQLPRTVIIKSWHSSKHFYTLYFNHSTTITRKF